MKPIKRTLYALAILGMLLGTAFSPMQQDQDVDIRITQIDTSEFPRVTFYVSVVDDEGNPVPVDPSRLVILENGEPIPADQIDGIGDVGPLTTLLVMDTSDSMNSADKLDSAKAAAHQYVDQMRETDQAGLLAFNTQVETVLPVTNDQAAIREAIDGMKARNRTAMYDALLLAVDELEGYEGRRAIIVLSDGMDNSSTADIDRVINRIDDTGFSISTVGLGVPKDYVDELEGIDEPGLTELADRAGGVYGYAEDQEQLTRLYQTYAIAMQSEYAISYISPLPLRDGVNRALSVELMAGAGVPVPAANQSETYNPGGLVPEVAQPVSWQTFGIVVAALVALLLLPAGVGALTAATAGGGGFGRKSSRVKLKSPPKVKLK